MMSNSYKLSIVARTKEGWHQQELLKAAINRGLDADITNLEVSDLSEIQSKLGDAVIWRSSHLDQSSERSAISGLLKNKLVVSEAVFNLPAISYKLFQQSYVASDKGLRKWMIPTYRVLNYNELEELVKNETLKLPFIAKPNKGSQGEGVLLVDDLKEMSFFDGYEKYIFQNYIKNTGDWRIIVVGGVPLGAMKRIAAPGSYVNNISRGASAVLETDQEVLNELYKISTKVASLFNLSFCGVDIIRDEATNNLYLLEVNTAPQWNDEYGFQAITGVDVAARVADFIVDKLTISKEPVLKLVENYYKKHIRFFNSESFHFSSRMWLWCGDNWSRKTLDDLREWYIGKDDKQIEDTLKSILSGSSMPSAVNQDRAYRAKSFAQYPQLPAYNAILFKTIFCDNIYDLDIREVVNKVISDQQFLELYEQLSSDHDSIRLLSTHAVNYFYLLDNYFKEDEVKLAKLRITEDKFIDLLPGYHRLENEGVINHQTSLKLQVYLLTHAIIGQSRFYANNIKDHKYAQICQGIEKIISENYSDISLDNKFEFLVCTELCGYKTGLSSIIKSEAEHSLSWAGNFLVDSKEKVGSTTHCLRSSEHRNVLYLMSQKARSERKEK